MESNISRTDPTSLQKVTQAILPFVAGCGSGMIATVCIQPIDTVKVRMQLTAQTTGTESPLSVARGIIARGGIASLYDGLSAGLLRQLVYGQLRLGLFATFERALEKRAHEAGTSVGFGGRAVAGLSAGALAALLGNPTEVALIRMQADNMKPVQERARYSSAMDALRRISRQEGILALWGGAAPTIVRAMSTNFGQLAFFSESKHQIQKHSSMSAGKRTALAAAIAGLAGAVISLPFDFVKTRLQNQSMASSTNLPVYSGTMDCFTKVMRQEGALRFYRDFWPYFMRVAPHSYVFIDPFSHIFHTDRQFNRIIALYLTDKIIHNFGSSL
ncbi:mitochondrial 2-oxoglutarate/malate carrier protein [Pyrenochaeta sp. DS3sAY3a]|nr:mitochondrial 2-oxoglutarate/malate carrier protein [Pyrenochaeta sp. DS3sAY3a]